MIVNVFSGFNRLLLLLTFMLLVSCKDDDPSPAGNNSNNTKINDWIYEEMQTWYLWNDELPSSPDKTLEPEAFFQSLRVPQDRFSWIQDNYEELINSLQGVNKEAGYEFVLYKESETSNNVIAQVLYVKPLSPAESAGLKRGDVITKINGQQLTVSNYRDVLDDISESHTIVYKPLNIEAGNFGAEQTVSLTTLQFAENPNFLHNIIYVGDKKIGYYVYNFFASDAGDASKQYDNQMQQIFDEFRNAGITDLILDLRFNSGGSESSSVQLASLIGNGIDNTKTFARREYNTSIEQQILDDPDLGSNFLITKFKSLSANVGSLLTDNRVYILTSGRTASASELVINALKPYMNVFLIGDVTYGKNVGSISISDEDNKDNKWGMQPIVVKVYNSLDQSDYSEGFTPDILNEDNSLMIYPLGDERENLLSAAIGQITGTLSGGRTSSQSITRKAIGQSLDLKRRGYNLFIDQTFPVFIKISDFRFQISNFRFQI